MDIAVRRPRPTDAHALFDLVAASDQDEIGYVDYELADAVEELSRPGLDLGSDAWLAVRDGRPVGYAAALLRAGTTDVDGEVYVHPDAGDELYAELLGRVRHRAAEHAARTPAREVLLSAYAPAVATSRCAAQLQADGWRAVRRFARMSIDVDTGRTAPPVPDRVTLRRGSAADPAGVHAVIMESFGDHFGFTPETFDDWLTRQRARAGHDTDLWLLAEVDGQPAAAFIGRHMADQGWVSAVGVGSAHRGRGLAKLLLGTAFADFAQRGYRRVALGVDTGNETGAFRLYESVGMRRSEMHDCYQLRVAAIMS